MSDGIADYYDAKEKEARELSFALRNKMEELIASSPEERFMLQAQIKTLIERLDAARYVGD